MKSLHRLASRPRVPSSQLCGAALLFALACGDAQPESQGTPGTNVGTDGDGGSRPPDDSADPSDGAPNEPGMSVPTVSSSNSGGSASGTGGDEGTGGRPNGGTASGGTASGGTAGSGGFSGLGGAGVAGTAGIGNTSGSCDAAGEANPADEANPIPVFVHPGGLHKRSDLDRMRLMVEAGVEPYSTAFAELSNHARASYDYVVQGDPGQTMVTREGTNGPQFEADATAAYLNALMWTLTGDERHAQKAVEIFNAWRNVTEVTGGGTEALNAGLFAWKLVEAAELIKSSYDGWSAEDIAAFSDMLVYPGYSNTEVPASLSQSNGSFYWRIYRGDPGRHGNQDLIAWRAMITMGVFLDNRVMFERALNYFKGEAHRADDLPYPSGPPGAGSQTADNEYFTTFQVAASSNTEENYGYNGVLGNYVWESGQNQESSRDQQHAFFGLGICAGIAEVAWNQGDDVYNSLDNRLLLGFEHMARYNVSLLQSFPDQPSPWEPTGAEFIQRLDRTGRWFSKQINPHFDNDFEAVSRGDFPGKRPVFEQPLAHYQVRMGMDADATLWTERGRDVSVEQGGLEGVGFSLDHPGWGALTFRRPTWAAGDPISGFEQGVPVFAVTELPGTVSAVHYDHFPANGEGHTYHDTSSGNAGVQYRSDDVDIACGSEDDYVVADFAAGEWLSYTLYVPATADYAITLKYAATDDGASVSFATGGTGVTGDVVLPSTNGAFETLDIGTHSLTAGVQTFRLTFSGVLDGVQFAEFSVEPR